MGWLVAWVAIALLLASGVVGVSFPMLYGFFISGIVVGVPWLVCAIINSLLGTRK